MANEKILSDSEIGNIEDLLELLKKIVEGTTEAISSVVSLFGAQGVVQSFFESGDFGKGQQEAVGQIALQTEDVAKAAFAGAASLYAATRQFLEVQRDLRRRGVIVGRPGEAVRAVFPKSDISSGAENGAKPFTKLDGMNVKGEERLEVK